MVEVVSLNTTTQRFYFQKASFLLKKCQSIGIRLSKRNMFSNCASCVGVVMRLGPRDIHFDDDDDDVDEEEEDVEVAVNPICEDQEVRRTEDIATAIDTVATDTNPDDLMVVVKKERYPPTRRNRQDTSDDDSDNGVSCFCRVLVIYFLDFVSSFVSFGFKNVLMFSFGFSFYLQEILKLRSKTCSIGQLSCTGLYACRKASIPSMIYFFLYFIFFSVFFSFEPTVLRRMLAEI